ncbi:MAG: thioredoxin domain-containing protein [Solirubrobacterales bacterium]
MTTNSEKVPNKLITEKSPYLLQHAYNPVKWYPWGSEAFEKAKAEDKPIFLSIGYSTCHWCHVMERESFEDMQVAEILNENFVAIKVDREERPDIDNIYMTYCQAITGNGGWPLSIFMTSDKKPFFAGTYFPKNERYGRMGFMEILHNINEAWENNKEKLLESSNNMHKELSKISTSKENEAMDPKIVENTVKELKSYYEEKHGGFSNAPKFPTPHNLMFLLRYYHISKDTEVLNMVENTLASMYKGGIFDHIGFGFSRYSTDSKWLVPHFEKMLYDNALLAFVYTEAYHLTKNNLYKKVAEKVFEYVLKTMQHKGGGFYSAEDADSEGIEGKFYIWTKEEVVKMLGEEEGELFSKYYDITFRGNFEGKNIPNLINSDIDEIQNNPKLEEKLEGMLKQLYIYRENRIHPFKDDKILTSWNGLMIAALAYGGRVFENSQYIEAAENSAKFIIHKLINEEERLLSRFREGEASNLGLLEDYAFLVFGLIELYEVTLDSFYLDKAVSLNDDMIKLFYDQEHGGFFLYGEDGEELIMRPKDFYDGAVPSGNSAALINMVRLSKILGRQEYMEIVDKTFLFAAEMVSRNPAAYTYLALAYMLSINHGNEIVIAGNRFYPKVKDMIMAVNAEYMPFSTLVLNDDDAVLNNLIPQIKDQKEIQGEAVGYVCHNYACSKPTVDLEEFQQLIKK